MRYPKILGLTAAIVAALMGFAGGAGATTVSSTTGGAAATPTVHLVNEGHLNFAHPIAVISCNSTLEGKVATHGSGVTTQISVTGFSLPSCTNSWHATTINLGTLEIHWTSGHDGTVTWTGAKVGVTRLGITCVYETFNTALGTVVGGNPATLKLEATVLINKAESGALCGGDLKWSGSYATTSALYVAP